MQEQWEALGTGVVLKLTEPSALKSARSIVENDLARIDHACSRFRSDSELSRVNSAGGRAVRVNGLLIDALEVALRAARLTEGDVDPALGAALELAGYDRDWRLLDPAVGFDGQRPHQSIGHGVRARVRSGWQTIELDRERSTVQVPSGIQLDLGATAKAWAADRAADAVHQATGVGVLVSLGGDIATSGKAPAHGWRIRVTEDHRAGVGAPGQTIAIQTGGLATSTVTVRRWRHRGADRHHIIDPSTAAPADGPWRTASVVAGSCTDANIASTAALVRGAAAVDWLAERDLPALLVSQDGRPRVVGGWPREGTKGFIAA
jgi:thiamine biosynthesis lipoprotein